MYCVEFKYPSQLIHPQNILLTFTGVLRWISKGFYFSGVFLHKLTELFCAITTCVSSENITFCHCSDCQCLFPRHQKIRRCRLTLLFCQSLLNFPSWSNRSPPTSAIRDFPLRGSCWTLPFWRKFFKIGPTVLGCIPNDSLILLLFNPFEFNITIRSFQSVDSFLFFFDIVYI